MYILKKKIPEGQEHAPRLEPTAPIRLADSVYLDPSVRFI